MKASLFGSLSYYKLRAREHFVQNVFGRRRKSYGVGSIGEIFNQALIVLRAISGWETMGKKAKLMTGVDLRNGQCNGSAMADTMKGDFPDPVQDVMQVDHRNSAPGVNKSCCVLCS
jgi:hypothetical protein